MTLRRVLTGGLFGLLLAAAAAPVASASAAPGYPPDGDVTISVSATVVTVGSTVTVTGSGWAPNSSVDVSSALTSQGFAPLTGDLGSFRSANAVERLAAAAVGVGTSAAGTFSTPLTLNQVGTVVITASGTSAAGAAASASATVQVVPAADGGDDGSGSGSGSGSGGDAGGVGGLPDTGASLGLPITLGAILVLGGAGLLTVVRRRKGGNATA